MLPSLPVLTVLLVYGVVRAFACACVRAVIKRGGQPAYICAMLSEGDGVPHWFLEINQMVVLVRCSRALSCASQVVLPLIVVVVIVMRPRIAQSWWS